MPYCPNCGNEVTAAAAFCADCGEALGSDTPSAETAGAAEADRQADTEQRVDASTHDSRESETGHTDGPGTTEGTETATGSALAGRFWINSLLGGLVGFLLAGALGTVFLPAYVFGIVGGGVVGGLLHASGVGKGSLVGAVAGLLATLPFLVLVGAFVVLGAGWFAAAIPADAPADVAEGYFAGIGVLAVIVSVIALVVNVLCGVVGGLVGGAVAK